MENGRVGVARSTVDMHRVRVRNRASVGATVARRAYSPAPCACVSTRQIRRRDRTRQPVTTPQLVTPLESVKQTSCNGDFGYRRVSPHPGLPLFTMRTLLSIWSADFLRCGGDQMMDSVFFLSDFFIKPSFTRLLGFERLFTVFDSTNFGSFTIFCYEVHSLISILKYSDGRPEVTRTQPTLSTQDSEGQIYAGDANNGTLHPYKGSTRFSDVNVPARKFILYNTSSRQYECP
ncbi:hypothetical protein EVAR_11764_1 [Eumeta japonica]|uniref:Uncharacterized protein n=1 Tax=Eumeta variegata TaxID=151549 RepID=A0A4C1UR35_EUMVA|nr:hypothetical protein EVAR_11764_1 [Eumeta japonica]